MKKPDFFVHTFDYLSDVSIEKAETLMDFMRRRQALQADMDAVTHDIRAILLEMIGELNEIRPQTEETRRSIRTLASFIPQEAPAKVEPPPAKSTRPVKLLVACAIIISILAVGLFVFAGDVRVAVLRVVTGREAVIYETTTSDSLSLAGLYAPAMLPEGYTLAERNATSRAGVVILTYHNADGSKILYHYRADGEAAALDNEQADVNRTYADGLTSEGNDGTNILSGRIPGTVAVYRLEGPVSLAELETMALSIVKHGAS